MNDLAQNLIEELQCETVFTIPILGGIPVSEAVVVTWIIMAVLVVVSFILTRNLKVDHISKRQAVAESIVTGLMKMVQGMVGEKGKAYVPYLTTVMLYKYTAPPIFAQDCGSFFHRSFHPVTTLQNICRSLDKAPSTF